MSELIESQKHTGWMDYNRFSSRTKEYQKIGGQLGVIKLNGDLSSFYPYLKFGELIGVGYHTTSGFGRYKVIKS